MRKASHFNSNNMIVTDNNENDQMIANDARSRRKSVSSSRKMNDG